MGGKRPQTHLQAAVSVLQPHEVALYNEQTSAQDQSRGDFVPDRSKTALLRGVFPAGFTRPLRETPPPLRPELARMLAKIPHHNSHNNGSLPTNTVPKDSLVSYRRQLPPTETLEDDLTSRSNDPVRSSFSFPAFRVVLDHEGVLRPYRKDELSALPAKVYEAPLLDGRDNKEEKREEGPGRRATDGEAPPVATPTGGRRRRRVIPSCSSMETFFLYLRSIEARQKQQQRQERRQQRQEAKQSPPQQAQQQVAEGAPPPMPSTVASSSCHDASALLLPEKAVTSNLALQRGPVTLSAQGSSPGWAGAGSLIVDKGSSSAEQEGLRGPRSLLSSADLVPSELSNSMVDIISCVCTSTSVESPTRRDQQRVGRGHSPTKTRAKLNRSLSPEARKGSSSPRRSTGAGSGGELQLLCTGTSPARPRKEVVDVSGGLSADASSFSFTSLAEEEGREEARESLITPGEVIHVCILPTMEVKQNYCDSLPAGRGGSHDNDKGEVEVKVGRRTSLRRFCELVWTAIGAKRDAVEDMAFTLHACLPTHNSNEIVRLSHPNVWKQVLHDAFTTESGSQRLLVMVELSKSAMQEQQQRREQEEEGLETVSSSLLQPLGQTSPRRGRSAGDGKGTLLPGEMRDISVYADASSYGANTGVSMNRGGRRGEMAKKRHLLYATLVDTLTVSEAATKQKAGGGLTGLRAAPRTFTEELKRYCYDKLLNEYSPRRRRRKVTTRIQTLQK